MAEASASSAQSESMEDILQSIKRIIEDEPADKNAAPSDVLDLTEVVKDDAATPPVAAPAPSSPKPVSKKPMEAPVANTAEALVSDEAASAALAALKPIVETTQKDLSIPRIASPEMRNGSTVEDLLLEALRPMLKSWLDENLPVIVQKIVEKEVKRIVTFRQD